MTARSWWNVGLGAANVGLLILNVRALRRWTRLNAELEQGLQTFMETYLPGATVLKHLDADK